MGTAVSATGLTSAAICSATATMASDSGGPLPVGGFVGRDALMVEKRVPIRHPCPGHLPPGPRGRA